MRRHIGRSAILLLLAAFVPLVILAIALAVAALREQQKGMEAEALDRVGRIALVVDRELASQVNALATVAEALAEQGKPLPEVRRLLARVEARQPHWRALSLSDPRGERLVDVPHRITGALGPVVEMESHRRVVELGRAQVGGIVTGPRGTSTIAVRVPVERDGEVRYVLSAVVQPGTFHDILTAENLPTEWIAGIVDQHGNLVARSKGPPELIGRPPTRAILRLRARGGSGIAEARTLYGMETQSAWHVLPAWNWSVHVGISRDEFMAPLRRSLWIMAAGGIVTLVIVATFLWLLRRELVARRKEGEAKADSARLEAVQRVAAMVAHDFNNLLMSFHSGASSIRRRPADTARIASIADSMINASLRGAALTRQLGAMAGGAGKAAQTFRLQDRVDDLRNLMEVCAWPGVATAVEIPNDLWPVFVDRDALQAAITNLVINARDAVQDQGEIRVSATNVALAATGNGSLAGDYVAITVSDSGVGIPPDIVGRIFDPFYTTKPTGKGVGLGLSQVRDFATQSGGDVRVKSEPGCGSRFTIYLPRSLEDMSEAAPAVEAPGEQGSGCVLLVEDDRQVAASMAEVLADAGYQVRTVHSAADAVVVLQSGARVDVVLSDIVLGNGTSGLELLQAVRERFAGVPMVLMTGYSDALNKGPSLGIPVLLKPFKVADVVAALTAARETAG